MIKHYQQKALQCSNPVQVIPALVEALEKYEGFLLLHDCSPLLPLADRRIFFCLNPVVQVQSVNRVERIRLPSSTVLAQEHSLQSIEKSVSSTRMENAKVLPCFAGFYSYEYLHALEDIPLKPQKQSGFPDYYFHLYSTILEIPLDNTSPTLMHSISYEEFSDVFWDATRCVKSSLHAAPKRTATTPAPTYTLEALANHANMTKQAYCAEVAAVREAIAAGSVYQVNLSQQFSFAQEVPASCLYHHACSTELPAQGAFFTGVDGRGAPFNIVSASPETFFKRNGNVITSSPIKGTIAKQSAHLNAVASLETLYNDKNKAELAMIVDLLRNDLGKIAVPGSVTVANHARLQELPFLYHLVSDVTATLPPSLPSTAVIDALFPCGSITGAPKVAAMQFINDVEPTPRCVYTGAIGYFSPNWQATFSVAIRTALLRNQQVEFHAGGGVTFLSDPEDEYQETLTKTKNFLQAYLLSGGVLNHAKSLSTTCSIVST